MACFSVATAMFLWMALSISFSDSSAQKTCANIDMFSELAYRKYLAGAEFQTFHNTTLLVCAKRCQLRNRCASFNFGVTSGHCVLNEGIWTDSSLNFTDRSDTVYSDVNGWPEVLAGACASHTCPENTECRENGTGPYECVVVSCVDPPSVSKAQMTSSSRFIEIGAAVPYVCEPPYVPAGERTCLPNGAWRGTFKCLNLRSCANVRTCNSSYGDGNYWIYVSQGSFLSLIKVYCHSMGTSQETFLTLHGNNTFSDVPVFMNPTLAEQCGAWWYDQHCGKTVFNKLKLNPWQLIIYRYVLEFATSDCMKTSLGWAAGCHYCDDFPANGSFRIDTRGTGVKLASNITWIGHKGYNSSEPVVSWSDDRKILTGECVGGCDFCTPTGDGVSDYGFYVDLDPTIDLDLSTATFPSCSAPNS